MIINLAEGGYWIGEAYVPLPSDPAARARALEALRRAVEGPTPEEQAERQARVRALDADRAATCAEQLGEWVIAMARHDSGSIARAVVGLHRPVYLDVDVTPHLECRGCAPWMYEDDEGDRCEVGPSWPCETYKLVEGWPA